MTAAARYTVTDYLLDRLAELGADRIFGVPGDFTLTLLDHVEAHEQVSWVGTANELGAGYAADGFARLRGIGALCTTFGVGELSAINAVAGSFAEHVPVVHIVGAPTQAAQNAGRALHHSLGDGDFRHFFRMSCEVTTAQAVLTPSNAAAEIDRVLLEVRERRLPGYLLIAADVGEADAHPPTAPLPALLDLTWAPSLAAFTAAAEAVLAPVSGSAAGDVRAGDAGAGDAAAGDAAVGGVTVAVLADLLVQRMGAEPQLHALLSTGPLPHATLLWGRRVVDESGPGYLGTYAGAASDEVVRAGIEGADVLILAGVQFTDLTSGFFSQNFAAEKVIRLDPHRASVAGVEFGEIDLGDALAALTGILSANPPALPPNAAGALSPVRAEHADTGISPADGGDGSKLLAQNSLWDVVCDALEPGDLVLADQGTSFYGMGAHRLAHDVVFVGQPLWASIGFSLPALLGAALAAPERRPVLLIGDGAAQLTIAELGTMTRQGLAPIIVVVNNDGYTVERAIHGPNAAFNDIAAWDWTALPQAFARRAPGIRTARVETIDALRRALVDARANLAGLSLIEAVVPRLDVPPLLRSIAAAAARANAAPPA